MNILSDIPYYRTTYIELDTRQHTIEKSTVALRPLASLHPKEDENAEVTHQSWRFPTVMEGTPIAGWFLMENPENHMDIYIYVDDSGVPLF